MEILKLHLQKHLFPSTETWRKHVKKWYGSAVTAATETRVNVTKPTAETRVNRRVSATVSHISSTFPITDSWYFVLWQGPRKGGAEGASALHFFAKIKNKLNKK